MVEAGGVGILTLLDNTQLVDFNSSEKHHTQHIHPSEVRGGYTELRARRAFGFTRERDLPQPRFRITSV
jgi:hypothetical protein